SESVAGMIEAGVTHFYELGPGKVLTGLGKRIDRSVSWAPSPAAEGLAEFAEQILA
ncbi:MAG: malonyl CoA-acyl carrier protein transacylase, partial [Acidobacteriota bacterium]